MSQRKKIERKSQDNSTAHFPIAADARTAELHAWLWRFSRCGIKSKWKVVSRSSQPAMIPSSQALLSRDKRLPLDTWNQSGVHENVFGNLRLMHLEVSNKEFQSDDMRRNREAVLEEGRRRLGTQVQTDIIKAQFQCRHLRQGRWLRVLQLQWNYPITTWLDSKDSNYRICNSTNSLIHNRFSCKNSIQNTSHNLFWFSIGCSVVDQRSGDGSFIGWIEVFWNIPKFWDVGRVDCLCSQQGHPEFQFKKSVNLEEQKAQKEDRFLRERQIAFMIYDFFEFHDTVSGCAVLFSATLRDDNMQEFGAKWDEVLLSMSKIPSDDRYLEKYV